MNCTLARVVDLVFDVNEQLIRRCEYGTLTAKKRRLTKKEKYGTIYMQFNENSNYILGE